MHTVIFWSSLILLPVLALASLFLFLALQKWKKLAAELREDHRQMYQTINFLPDPTFVIDRKGRVVAWSRAMEELTGIVAADILGKGDRLSAGEQRRGRCGDSAGRCHRTGAP